MLRASCFFVASAYLLLALDLAASQMLSWMTSGQQTDAFGLVNILAALFNAPSGGGPFRGAKVLTFSLSVISLGCQQYLLELLARHEVLLRIVGAERFLATTICVILKGVPVANSQSSCAAFFEAVAPPPVLCILVVVARELAVAVGLMLAIVPRLLAAGILGSAASFACGLLGGFYVVHVGLRAWYENQQGLDSPALRLALLLPGSISEKAKDLLLGASVGVCQQVVQMRCMSAFNQFVRWCFRPKFALTM